MMFLIVGKADPLDGVGANALAVRLGQTDRSADARMEAEIFGERRRHHAFADIGLDEDVRLASAAQPSTGPT